MGTRRHLTAIHFNRNRNRNGNDQRPTRATLRYGLRPTQGERGGKGVAIYCNCNGRSAGKGTCGTRIEP
jgi:hypothetical protein